MAHVLIGWEFGAGRGHVQRMAQIAGALKAQGHRISFALQRLDGMSAEETDGAEVWQSPLSPRLHASGAHASSGPPAGMADILARLGFDEAAIVAAVVNGWDRMLAAIRPDVIVADFAPLLLLTAHDRIPTISVGTGFTAPPSEMGELPRLIEMEATVDPAALLAEVNRGLDGAGRPALDALPRIFAADRELAADFVELDPYAAWRRAAPSRPLPPEFAARAGGGEEIFVYAGERTQPHSPLWTGLAGAGLPVRIHALRATTKVRDTLVGHGFAFEAEPVPFAEIAARSRMVLSHGGHGFTCASLAAGLPHVIFYYDLEKLLNGVALARLGLGGHVSLRSLEPRAFAASLRKIYHDDEMAARVRAAAPGFLERGQVSLEEAVCAAVPALL